MSSTYNLEPQPTAKVLLQTTSGDILLELFAKQTPLTSRNFLQLCLDGYYDNTIFQRLIPGFIIQGGDPTGTGEGGESIYDDGKPFADEFHSRLKFNRRGLIGMANGGKKDDNASQFFLTLGKTEELKGKNTMFGRVVGDTIYNLMRMGEADLSGEGSERPLYPTKVTGTEILVNPFEGMERRERAVRAVREETRKAAKRKPGKKSGKTLLSFGGDELDEVDAEVVLSKPKFNTKLINAEQDPSMGTRPSMTAEPLPRKETHVKKHTSDMPSLPATPVQSTKDAPISLIESPPRPPINTLPTFPSNTKVAFSIDETNAQIAEIKASLKRTVYSVDSASPKTAKKQKTALEQMIPETSIRGRKRKQGEKAENKMYEKRALEIINSFRTKLDNAAPQKSPQAAVDLSEADKENGDTLPTGGAPKDEEEDEEEAHLCDLHFISNCQSCRSWDNPKIAESHTMNDDEHGTNDTGWMSHALSFEKDRLGKDLTWRRKNEEELVVIDPREKGKEIKMGSKGGGR